MLRINAFDPTAAERVFSPLMTLLTKRTFLVGRRERLDVVHRTVKQCGGLGVFAGR